MDPQEAILTAVAKPLASKLIDALIRPAAAVGRLVSEPLIDTFSNRFSEYLARQLEKHSHLPTIVFQVRKPLDELYLPITVVEDCDIRDGEKPQQFKLDRFQQGFLPALKRIMLIDDAGMGKTTVSRFLLVQAAKSLSTVPVFIELRHLTSEKSITDIILAELNPLDSDLTSLKIDKRQLTRLLEKGLFTFFFDGYDEIVSKHRESVTIDLKSFVESYPDNCYLLTSRPEHSLTSFPSFKVFNISSLEKQEAYALIRKYDNDGERSRRLIERLEEPSLRSVHEFLKNPLLTTLLYRAYDYKNQIPLKKPVFYRQVYDALYEWHDLTKDGYSTRTKECGLDIDGFHKVLRGLGFISVLRGRVEADTDEVLQWIREARTYAPELRFAESDFLDDAIKAVPLLRREGSSIIWAHKSLSEYFASQFVIQDAKQDQRRILEHIAGSPELRRFQNFLGLLYDTDVAVFNQYFTKPLIDAYRASISELRVAFPWISKAAAELRASVSLRGVIATYSTSSRPEAFARQVHADAVSLSSAWGRGRPADESEANFISSERIGLQFVGISPNSTFARGGSKIRALMFINFHGATIDVLTEKKAPLMLLRPFYPNPDQRVAIVGISGRKHQLIDSNPESVWNSPKNFERTTLALTGC